MEREKIYDKLEQLLNILKKVCADYKTIDTWAATRNFMEGIYDIYIVWRTDPSITNDPKFQEFISESSPKLGWFSISIDRFMFEIEDTLSSTFYDSEWMWICRQRSSIEALKEMYQNTRFEEFFENLDAEDLDERIKVRGKIEGHIPEELIPKGIPPSHWWWWYPDTPPIN